MILFLFIGIAAGFGVPIQTSLSNVLRNRVGSAFNVALINFFTSAVYLAVMLLLAGKSLAIPFDTILQEPFWIWGGGICGVIYLTGNLLLFPILGGVQTVILMVTGQILMGLVIDHFGLFYAIGDAATPLRLAGAVLVIIGVVIVSLAKNAHGAEKKSISAEEKEAEKRSGSSLFLWRILGLVAGMSSACQTAINGYLGRVLHAPVQAGMISCCCGTIALVVICVLLRLKHGKYENLTTGIRPWWMWTGGLFGGTFILANLYLAGNIGTGLAVIFSLIGLTSGGLMVDHFGWFRSPKKPMSIQKGIGVAVMIVGAIMVRLL